MPFRVIAYGDERKEVGGGASRELNYYRRFLAGLRFRCAFPFHQIISMEMDAQPAVSLVVAVTSSLTPMLSELLASYTMQGYRVSLIVVPNEAAEEGDGSGGISGIGEAGLQAFAVAQNQADPLNMNPRSEEVSARAS
ncbi:MAG: hypothetical protein FWF83_04515 [Clostridiales bacterium]|nr:hypothetical protein [Clostridiales bacterium]